MNDTRTWKWLVPGMLAPILLVLQLWINDWAVRANVSQAFLCGFATWPMMALCAVQAWAGFRSYYRQIDVDQFVARKEAEANTAEVRLFDRARGMHPEAVRLLLKHRTMVWRIRETPLTELVDWVLDADPRVHFAFVEHVLEHSNFYAIMPKNLLSDKSHSFDPTMKATDYEQYDAFIKLCQHRGMLTEAFGNQPGQWIEPWSPELVGRRFGVILNVEEEKDGEPLAAVKL